MAKLFCVINNIINFIDNIVNVINNVPNVINVVIVSSIISLILLKEKSMTFEAVCYANYQEFSQDFVINVTWYLGTS